MKISSVEKLRLALLAWITARREFSTYKNENFILAEDRQIKLGDAVKVIEISINYENLLGFVPKLVVEHYGTESIFYIGCVSEKIIEELTELVVAEILGTKPSVL